MFQIAENLEVNRLEQILSDQPAETPEEVFRRCAAADALGAMGSLAISALPALLNTLIVPVMADCGIALRVAAAEAVWRVGNRVDLALPFLAWAVRDEYWGVAQRAVVALAEIGHPEVVPDLVRLAERRLKHGPFHYEAISNLVGQQEPEPLMVAIAEALGRCGRVRRNGLSNACDAEEMLARLSKSEDKRICETALKALKNFVD